MKRKLTFFLAMAAAVLLSLPTQAAEVKDSYGVITSPADGVHKVFKRAGKAYTYSSDNAQDQSGRVEIVECEDGTVYIKDIISLFANNTWVKGTKSGNTITVPTGQLVFDEEDGWYDTYLYKLAWGSQTYDDWWEEYTKTIDNSKTEITFTVNGDVITLEGSSEDSYIGIFRNTEYSSSNTFRYGDYATVWTLDADYEPASTELVETPAGLETASWYVTGASGSTPFKRSVAVGFAGSDVYVQGLFTDFPDAWVKGTISGTTATFKAMQYLGQKSGKNVWLTGEGLENVTMTYDATKQKLTSDGSLIATNSEDKVSAVATLTGVVLFAEDEKIDELPYTNALTSASDFLQFIVVDANNDGKTWNYTTANGVRYSYSGYNDGDDWLISPAIRLEAGKLYHFAINAKNEGYPERLEVKLAAAPTAEALADGISVVTATDVTSSSFVTYENETVAVTATGYYHFGVHAISEADQYFLTVANLLVEEGAAATAPAAVGSLTVAQAEGELAVNISFSAPAKNLNGDDLTANLAKIEILRDGTVVKTFTDVAPGASLSFKDEAGLTYGSHTYQVLPYDATGAGQKSEAEVFVTGTLVAAPADLATATWNVRYNTNTKTTAIVGFSGSEVYVQGLFTQFPTAWIKGTVSGSTATFATGQYLGTRNGNLVWMTSDNDDDELVDFVMDYDADAKVFTAQNDLIANYGLDEIYPLTTLKGLVIQEEEFGEPAATTAANVDALPYTNALNTQALFADFGVLDVNEDGYTWEWSASSSAPYYNYEYFADDAANDWLVSPAIKLEAGKKYHFAADLRKSGSDTQKVEVKIATKATATKLAEGITVLPSTNLTTTSTTYENKEVTVTETGYYHFGFHAFTDAWSNIYVQNFLVEAGVEDTAPAAVIDLAVVQNGEELAANVSFTAPATDLGGNALTENLTKVEVLRDEAVVKTFTDVAPGAALNFTDDADLTLGTHKYVVVAYNESGAGEKSAEVIVKITGVASVPYVADLTNQDTFSLFTVIDNNGDNSTWKWGSATSGARYACNDYEDGDDYLVTMPIRLEDGTTYTVTVTARNYYDDWDSESFEVLVGQTATAEGLTQVVIENTDVESSEFEDFTGSFTVSESGKYYVAIHATSEAYNYYLYVKTLAIEEVASATTITIGDTEWATIVSEQALDFSETDLTAYIVTGLNDEGTAVAVQAVEAVPANTPLLVNGAAGEYEIPSAVTTPAIGSDNKLVAGKGKPVSAVADKTRYVLSTSGTDAVFKKINGTPATVPAGKAYLELDETVQATLLSIDFGTTTGIHAVSSDMAGQQVIYNINGQRVAQPTKGLYIVNGKKVFVK